MRRFSILLLSVLIMILVVSSAVTSSIEEFINVPADPAEENTDVPAGPAEEPTDAPAGPTEGPTNTPAGPAGPDEESTDDTAHISAEVKVSAGLYHSYTDISEAAAVIPAGTRVRVEQTENPLWCLVIPDAAAQEQRGEARYMYAENLCRVTDNKAADITMYEEYAAERFDELKEIFPHGKYWNHTGTEVSTNEPTPYYVTDTPCTHYHAPGNEYCCDYCNRYFGGASQYMTMQCLGFANLLSDEIFGESAPVHSYSGLNRLRVGDHIRCSFTSANHSLVVTGIYDTYITVAEVNRDYNTCMIEWERVVDLAELENDTRKIVCYTRYPFDFTGTEYVPWQDEGG